MRDMETITHLIEREAVRCGQIGTWIAHFLVRVQTKLMGSEVQTEGPEFEGHRGGREGGSVGG